MTVLEISAVPLTAVRWADLKPILVAVAIGVMVGAERERSHSGAKEQFGGVRTFAILAATGALAALVSPAVVAAGFVATAALVALGYWNTLKSHPGSTTAVAGLATYLLGALTRDHAGLAVGVSVLVVVLLLSKERLHRLLRDVVSDTEVADAVKFLVLVFVVLPLLPDRAMGPYGVLNPFRIWLLVVLVVGMGWLGYLGVRVLGARRGLLVGGFAGGFVSATATTAAMGRLAASSPREARAALAGAFAASLSTVVQLLFVVGVLSREVLVVLAPPALVAGIAIVAAIGFALRSPAAFRGLGPPVASATSTANEAATPTHAPGVRAFALRPALLLAAILTVTLLVSRWAAATFGDDASIAVAAMAGLADGHAGAVTSAALAARGDITTVVAVWSAAASLGTNTLVKVIAAAAAGGRTFAWHFAMGIMPAAAAFAVATWLL